MRIDNNTITRFRWVACQMDHLCGLPTDAARRNALRELPPDLFTTYDRILERVNTLSEESCLLVERVLKWIFDGFPLSTSALCEALSINPGDRIHDPDAAPDVETILTCCSSLVRLSTDNNNLELAHFTVKEYLNSHRVQKSEILERYFCSKEIIDVYRASTSLIYLCLEDFARDRFESWELYEGLISSSPFYRCAAKNWPSFLPLVGDAPGFAELVEEFFRSCPTQFTLWKRAFAYHRLEAYTPGQANDSRWYEAKAFTADSKPFHYAAMLQLDNLMQRLASLGHDVDERCTLGTPLHFAIVGRDIFSVSKMTSLGFGTSPLLDKRDKISTVETLVQLGADVNQPIFWKGVCQDLENKSCNPVCFACQREDVDMAKIFFAAGARLDSHVMKACLQFLRERRFGRIDERLVTVLTSQKVAGGDQELFAIFKAYLGSPKSDTDLHKSSDIIKKRSLTDKEVESSLLWACECDSLESFESIMASCHVDRQALVEYSERYLLPVSVDHASLRIVQRLLEFGCSVNVLDPQGELLLHTALNGRSSDPSPGVVGILLEHDANVESIDRDGNTSVHLWAKIERSWSLFDSKPILQLLLSKGANPQRVNAAGETKMHTIAMFGGKERLASLIDSVEPPLLKDLARTPDVAGRLPVHVAAAHGNVEVFEILKTIDASEWSNAGDGRSELHFAAQGLWRNASLLGTLLQCGADVFRLADDGSSITHDCIEALRNLHDKSLALPWNDTLPISSNPVAHHFKNAVNRLSLNGCDIARPRLDGKTPLYLLCELIAAERICALWPSRASCQVLSFCVEVLVDEMTQIMAQDSQGRTAVDILLTNAFEMDKSRRRRLDANCVGIKVLTPLLQRCEPCDVKDLSINNRSALSVAASLQNEEVALRLLELDADVDCQNESELGFLTPLQILCSRNTDLRAISIALTRTQDVRQRTQKGLSLLHLTASVETSASRNIIFALANAGVPLELTCSPLNRTAVMLAASAGCTTNVEALLVKGANPSVRDTLGYTAFTLACSQEALGVVQLLFDAKASWDFVEEFLTPLLKDDRALYFARAFRMGPIQLAACSSSTSVLEKLLYWKKYGHGKLQCLDGPSPLWICSYYGNMNIAQLILQHGYDPNAVDTLDDVSCLQVAAAHGHVEVVKLLLDAGCDTEWKDSFFRSALDHAILANQQDVIKVLSDDTTTSQRYKIYSRKDEEYADPGQDIEPTLESLGRSFAPKFLMATIKRGDLAGVKHLHRGGMNMSNPFQCGACTPLLVALVWDQLDVATYLLDQDISSMGRTCFEHTQQYSTCYHLTAMATNRTPLLVNIFDRHQGAELQVHERQEILEDTISLAAAYGNTDAIEQLVKRNFSPDCSLTNDDKVSKGERQIMRPILKPSSNISPTLSAGTISSIPLHAAVLAKQHKTSLALINAGANVDRGDGWFRTALHLAAEKGYEQCVELLLD